MRYREIINEVDHNPDVLKVPFDQLQQYMQYAQTGRFAQKGFGNVDNWVAVLGAVGHGMGQTGGVMNRQQVEPDSGTSANIRVDPSMSKNIAGSFNQVTGEIKLNPRDAQTFRKGVDRVAMGQVSDTILHEMMHRGFSIIDSTPELRKMMPADLVGYWKGSWGKDDGRYYIGQIQSSAEHAMIYTHTHSTASFEYRLRGIVPWDSFCREPYQEYEDPRYDITMPAAEMAGAIKYCCPQAVVESDSPVYGMSPGQLADYWRDTFEAVNRGIGTVFARQGPPRRLGRATAGKPTPQKSAKQKIEQITRDAAQRIRLGDFSVELEREIVKNIRSVIDAPEDAVYTYVYGIFANYTKLDAWMPQNLDWLLHQ